VVCSAAYVSYSLGANDVGNAIGPLLSKYPDKGLWLAVLGGVAIAVGAITMSSRVSDTVGKQITSLDYGGALSAQLAAAFGVHLFSMAGIPVSTSQATVG
jgi:PiT family inorganic phosphate transporter